VKLPEYLQRSDIEAGLAPFRGRLRTCAEQHETRGVVNVSVTVAADGSVGRVEVGDGEAAFKACVAGLLRQASFPRTRSGHTFRYPLVLR
jgi:outer membrane biosynthesis protein TonB